MGPEATDYDSGDLADEIVRILEDSEGIPSHERDDAGLLGLWVRDDVQRIIEQTVGDPEYRWDGPPLARVFLDAAEDLAADPEPTLRYCISR